MSVYDFENLDELPLALFERAGKLGHAGNAPILTIIPEMIEPPKPPAMPNAIPLAETYERTYLTQVTYPRVVCYPTGDLVNEVAFEPRDVGDDRRDVVALASAQRFYKLTSLTDDRFRFGYLCTVHYGPYSAVVKEFGPCLQGDVPRWELHATPFPNVILTWYGTWEDIPDYPNLHVLMTDLYLAGEKFACCPGFAPCASLGGACVDEQIVLRPDSPCSNVDRV